MSDEKSPDCATTVLSFLVLWALFFGLPTPWGNFNIDILPPAIRLEHGAAK